MNTEQLNALNSIKKIAETEYKAAELQVKRDTWGVVLECVKIIEEMNSSPEEKPTVRVHDDFIQALENGKILVNGKSPEHEGDLELAINLLIKKVNS